MQGLVIFLDVQFEDLERSMLHKNNKSFMTIKMNNINSTMTCKPFKNEHCKPFDAIHFNKTSYEIEKYGFYRYMKIYC